MIAGETFRVGVGGSFAYAISILAVAGTAHLWMKHRRWCREIYGRLPAVWRAFLVAHVAPMTVWFLLPPRMRILVKTFFARAEEHKAVYDPLAMIRNDLFAAPWTALALAVLVAGALALWRQTSVTGRRYLWLTFLIFLPTAMVPYEPRYALPALVPLIPLAAVTLTRLLAETIPSLVRNRSGRPPREVGFGGVVISIVASVVMVSSMALGLELIVGQGLPRPYYRKPGLTAARIRIVDAAGGRSGPLLVLTIDPELHESNIQAAFNDRHQRVLTGIIGWIQLDGRDADTALAETLRELRPELIITYRSIDALTRIDPVREAILEALGRRTDYEIIETARGANEGDVLELRVPIGVPNALSAPPPCALSPGSSAITVACPEGMARV